MSEKMFQEVVEHAARLDRDAVRETLQNLLRQSTSASEWVRMMDLALSLGEGWAAIEAARRYSLSDPASLQRRLAYCETLAEFGKEDEALAILRELSARERCLPPVEYLTGLLLSQAGEFDKAERSFRAVIASGIASDAAWHKLSVIKRFELNDQDLGHMRSLAQSMKGRDAWKDARIGFAIAKAEWDAGDYANAFRTASEAAATQRSVQSHDADRHDNFVQRVLDDFTSENLQSLTISEAEGSRTLFVTGLPRSGTTLAERLLAAHPDVRSAGECDLWGFRFFRTEEPDFAWASAMDRKVERRPWQRLAKHYSRLIEEQFPEGRHVVDKSVLQMQWMGLLLHALPDAKVVYVERDAGDRALSCFRTFFPQAVPWTNDLVEIGRYFAAEYALLHHWREIFPDRILTISYEEMVRNPGKISDRMVNHFGLAPRDPEKDDTATNMRIKTASLFQARQSVDEGNIGNSGPVRDLVMSQVGKAMQNSRFARHGKR